MKGVRHFGSFARFRQSKTAAMDSHDHGTQFVVMRRVEFDTKRFLPLFSMIDQRIDRCVSFQVNAVTLSQGRSTRMQCVLLSDFADSSARSATKVLDQLFRVCSSHSSLANLLQQALRRFEFYRDTAAENRIRVGNVMVAFF